jgi:hypothetical protein
VDLCGGAFFFLDLLVPFGSSQKELASAVMSRLALIKALHIHKALALIQALTSAQSSIASFNM